MLSICLHLLWESESARRPLYLRTRVSTFPKEREECRQAATLYDGFQPVPAVSAANASDPSRPLERTGSAFAAPEPSASPASRPKLPVLRPRRFGEAPNHRHYRRNPHRAGASPSRRGERHCTYSSETAPAVRRLSFGISGVMRVPASAPQPAAAPLHPPHPSASIRPPSSGSRASLFVFRDTVLTHLRHSTLPGSPAATVPERGRCALRPHPPRCRAVRKRPAPQLPGPRDSVRLRRPQTLRPKQHLS